MRGNDWGALLAMGFSLLVAWFFVLNTDLPRHTMTENYAFMTADYAAAVQEGRLYPRWAAHAESGYGAPIYHFAPPGAPYLSGMIAALITGDAVAAVRVVFLIGFMLASVGVYGIVVRHRGAAAGVVAAMLYITSPYFGLTAPHIRGDVAGVLALGLLPVLLWSIDRLVSANYPQDFAFVAVVAAALLLTAPRVAAVGLVYALALIGWHKSRRWGNPYYVRLSILALATGVLLASFYWVPALAERGYVRWETFEATTKPLFLTWGELVARYHQTDPAAMIPEPQLTLGWLRLGVFALAGMGVVRVQRGFTVEAMFIGLGALTTLLAILVFPVEIWLLGAITLCVAVSSSAALALRERFAEQTQRLILAIALMVILGGSSPAWLPPEPTSRIINLTPLAQVQHEQRGYGVAVVPRGSAYPTTLPTDAIPSGELVAGYRNDIINRIPRSLLSSSLRASLLEQNTHAARYQFTARSPHQIDFLLAYFPGWLARLEGRRDIQTAGANNGLVTFNLPATTNGVLSVWLGSTQVRRFGWIVSASAALTLVLVTRQRYLTALPQYHDVPLLTLAEVRLLTLLFVFSGLILYFTARFDAPISIRVPPGIGLRHAEPLDLRSNVGVNLIGYEINTKTFRHGDTLTLKLYWSALVEQRENYRVQITLYSIDDPVQLSKPVIRYPGGVPPTRWTQNQYIHDLHYIEINERVPLGEYIVAVTLENCAVGDYSCNPNDRPIFFENDGFNVGHIYELPAIIQVIE